MVAVTHAECKRALARDDQLCADVVVKLEGKSDRLIAIFAESRDNDYDMVMVLQKDEDSGTDWYDNELPAAYVDVTEKLFADEEGEIHWGPREHFKEQVLSFGNVREQIRSKLEEAKRTRAEA